jgi:opacity protein-like surface antigen
MLPAKSSRLLVLRIPTKRKIAILDCNVLASSGQGWGILRSGSGTHQYFGKGQGLCRLDIANRPILRTINKIKENGMKRLALLCGLAVMFAGVAAAQGDNPKVEAFGGYSLIHNGSSFGSQSINFNGAGGSISYNPSGWLGLVGDFGGNHYSKAGLSANVITYLFGPKLSYRASKFTPFAQVLFGGARLSASTPPCPTFVGVTAQAKGITLGSCGSSGSINSFAMTFGGGLDYNLTKHIGIRPVQFEYLMTRFGSQTQNNLRYEAGVVFRW